jgi:hypothetical protein
MSIKLNANQIEDLAKPLPGIIEKFYQDPKNEEAFQKWLLNVDESSTGTKE